MKHLYKLNKEDKEYKILLDKNNFFLHNLLPNNINIHPLLEINNEVIKYVEYMHKQMCYLIYPVYKHLWKNMSLYIKKENNNIFSLICDSGNSNIIDYEFFNFSDKETFVSVLKKKNHSEIKKDKIYIKELGFSFSYEAYSLFYLETILDLNINNITPHFILGILDACIKIGIGSIPFKQKHRLNKTKYGFEFSTIKLKSLYISNQIRIFNTWKNSEDVIITGGTGIGKTSQIPKLFWWINFLYDGFDDILNFDTFNFSLAKIKNYNNNVNSRSTVLSLPRKILIQENSINVANSLGFKHVQNTPINCKYKDVKESEFYNENAKQFITPFIFSINRSTTIYNTNTIIFDEIHEHDTYCDIGISIARHFKKKYKVRNIVLITATITDDIEILRKFLPKIIEIHIKGDTLFPIKEIDYSKTCNEKNNYNNLDKIINTYSRELGMSTLVFFPTLSYIRNMTKILENQLDKNKYVIIEVHRESAKGKEEDNVLSEFKKHPGKHIIALTTPIAESSLTIKNAQIVIDSGLFYSKQFFSGKTINITRSMMEQRKGRVGRLTPGIYIRLFDENKLNQKFKKIDYEFLIPYIINCLYYDIKFNDLFILPSNMDRFQQTLTYYNKKGLNIEKDINSLFQIYSKNNCNLGEYLIVYLKGSHKEKFLLSKLEEFSTEKDQLKLIHNNLHVFYSIAKKMNIGLSIGAIQNKKKINKHTNLTDYYYKETRVHLKNYYESVKDYYCTVIINSRNKPLLITEKICIY